MKVELLPSSIPPTEAQFLVSFLVNDVVAFDAGPLGLLSDLAKQERVRHAVQAFALVGKKARQSRWACLLHAMLH